MASPSPVPLSPMHLLTGNARLNSLYHAFFFLEHPSLKSSGDFTYEVLWRVPRERSDIDDLELGLKLFVVDSSIMDSRFGFFVLTLANASRFYAMFDNKENGILLALSSFPLVQFSREVFHHLRHEKSGDIPAVLYTLTQYPILAAPCLRYNITLPTGSACLAFTPVGDIIDTEISALVAGTVTPHILISVWEALLLERKVLVVSSSVPIVTYCCEFFRKLILPLSMINTYVPCLPESLLNTVEAPFPYLVGALRSVVFDSPIDLHDIVLIDLDRQHVRHPRHLTSRAPTSLKERLHVQLSSIMTSPLVHWASRSVSEVTSPLPHTPDITNQMMYSAQECFMSTTMSLLSFRFCDVRAFYRRPNEIGGSSPVPDRISRSSKRGEPRSIQIKAGVTCGCLLFVNEYSESQFLSCWIELDQMTFSVYEFADELPIVFFLAASIEAVLPTSMEPEGHVFDIITSNQISYRFATADPDARPLWIQAIEEAKHRSRLSTPIVAARTRAYSRDVRRNNRRFSGSSDGYAGMDELEMTQFSAFRCDVMRSQAISYYRSCAECIDYENILKGTPHSTKTYATQLLSNHSNSMDLPPTPSRSKRSGDKLSRDTERTAADATNEKLSIYWDLCVFRDQASDKPVTVPMSPSRNSQRTDDSETPVRRRDRLRQELHRIKCALMRCRSDDGEEKNDQANGAPSVMSEIDAVESELLKLIAQCHQKLESTLRKLIVESRMQRTHILTCEDTEKESLCIEIDVAAVVNQISVMKRFDFRAESCDLSPTSWPDMMSACTDDSMSLSELSGTADGDDNAEMFTTTGSNCSVFDLRQAIAKRLSEAITKSKESVAFGALRAMRGFVYENLDTPISACEDFEAECLLHEKYNMMSVAHNFFAICNIEGSILPSSIRVEEFLRWAQQRGHYAQRLITEILHRLLCMRILRDLNATRRERSYSLGQMDPLLRRELTIGKFSKRRIAASRVEPQYTFVENDGAANNNHTLNEVVICTASSSEPCALALQLLGTIKELLRSAYQNSIEYTETVYVTGSNLGIKVLLTEDQRNYILNSSAYKAFQQQACQVQKVVVDYLTEDEKAYFLIQLYNVMTVHGMIVKGPNGKNFIDRILFLSKIKYNIGGVVFSLLEIEFLLLRAQTCSVFSALGQTIISLTPLSSRDARYKYALKTKLPLVTFALCLGTESSPSLHILRDPHNVESELHDLAKAYLKKHIIVDKYKHFVAFIPKICRSNRTIYLPELVYYFRKDFGTTPREVAKTMSILLGPPSNADMIELLRAKKRTKYEYLPFQFNFMIVL